MFLLSGTFTESETGTLAMFWSVKLWQQELCPAHTTIGCTSQRLTEPESTTPRWLRSYKLLHCTVWAYTFFRSYYIVTTGE
jgi:hypothetical protein